MLDSLAESAEILIVVWAVLLVHEFGHYYTGRQIIEIPKSDIKLVSFLFPRYVALRDGDDWVAPTEFERYRSVYERHDPSYEHLERFVAGGEIIQTLVIVPVAIILALAGFAGIATTVLGISMLTTLVYVIVDALWTWQSNTPSGDYSALWAVSPRIPALLLIGFFFVHLGAFFFVV